MSWSWIADLKHDIRLNDLNTPFEKLDGSRVEEFTVRRGPEIVWGMKGKPASYDKQTGPTRGIVHVIDTGTEIVRIYEDTGEVERQPKS